MCLVYYEHKWTVILYVLLYYTLWIWGPFTWGIGGVYATFFIWVGQVMWLLDEFSDIRGVTCSIRKIRNANHVWENVSVSHFTTRGFIIIIIISWFRNKQRLNVTISAKQCDYLDPSFVLHSETLYAAFFIHCCRFLSMIIELEHQ
jgi:hypothetical protein